MKSILKLGLVPALILVGTACSSRVPAVVNAIDTSEIDFSNVDKMKSGTACEGLLFNVIPLSGSSDLVDAIKDAKVSHVTAVEYEFTTFIVFGKRCVTVFGDNKKPGADAPVRNIAPPAPEPAPAEDEAKTAPR